MRFLLDTHPFLWWIDNDRRLSATARDVIADERNEAHFSVASAWELAIKARLGRLELPRNLSKFITDELAANDFHVLPVDLAHALAVRDLPDHHRDPFDRLLAAQSRLERMPIITADRAFAGYEVQTIW